jgi:acyl-CoA thioesterase-1
VLRRLVTLGYAVGLGGPTAFLCRAAARPRERRVVFFGASITEDYPLARHFPGQPYLNRGEGGQLAYQMLQRFERDVLDLAPRAVVLKVCAINFGPQAPPLGVTEAEYVEMVARAAAAGIRPVLTTVVPVSRAWAERKGPRVQDGVLAFGDFARREARRRGLPLADYHGRMAGPDGFVQAELSSDGLHLSAAGYAVMTETVGPALAAALGGAGG